MRTVPEWIGETPETAVLPRVKLRVFDVYLGRCPWSGKKISAGDRWDVDHARVFQPAQVRMEQRLEQSSQFSLAVLARCYPEQDPKMP